METFTVFFHKGSRRFERTVTARDMGTAYDIVLKQNAPDLITFVRKESNPRG